VDDNLDAFDDEEFFHEMEVREKQAQKGGKAFNDMLIENTHI